MEFGIDESFLEMMKDRKISEDEVNEVLENYTKINVIDMNLLEIGLGGISSISQNVIVSLFLRKYGNFHILIVARRKEKEITNVQDGFKINRRLIPDIENLRPLEALRSIIEKFGLDHTIGGNESKSKFFVMQIIEPAKKGKTLLSEVESIPKGHTVSIQSFFGSRSDGKFIVALSYAIDETRLREGIYTSGL